MGNSSRKQTVKVNSNETSVPETRPKTPEMDALQTESPLKQVRHSNFLEWDSDLEFTEYPLEGRYVGELQRGTKIREGQGTMYYWDGATYTGSWRNDKYNGQGKWEHKNSTDYYDGNWVDCVRDGKGIDFK